MIDSARERGEGEREGGERERERGGESRDVERVTITQITLEIYENV